MEDYINMEDYTTITTTSMRPFVDKKYHAREIRHWATVLSTSKWWEFREKHNAQKKLNYHIAGYFSFQKE